MNGSKACKNLFYFVFMAISALPTIVATAAKAENFDIDARQAYMMDYDTGAILFEKNPDETMPTSSMSKVMTIYMVFDALKKGDIKLDDSFQVSEKAWRMQGSKMYVPVHENVTVEDLIRGVVIQSGNDATIVLAEGLAGSEEAFALAMNKKMKEMGMKNSHFTNASGWPDPDHYSTARDLTILAKRIIQDFPDYYPYFAEKEFVFHDIKQGNRNPLLYRNNGADGIKTGHTEAAGFGLMGSGIKDGRRVVFVANGMKSMQARADESAKLMGWGLSAFENVKIFDDAPVLDKAPVLMGQALDVPLQAAQPVTVTLPKLADKNVIKVNVSYNAPLVAPVKKGQEVGAVRVQMEGSEDIIVPLVAAADVEDLPYILRLLIKARTMMSGEQSG